MYLVLDTSGSMSGEPIEAVKNGVQALVSALRSDPYALETVHLSVITFGSQAAQTVPLTELMAFQPPELHASGATALGEALALTAERIDAEVQKTTADSKGDWKPLVFLMTDGMPTDDLQRGLQRFHGAKTGMVVACAAGAGADTAVLKKITESVVQLDTADSSAIKAFFKWVSASVSVGSQKVDGGAEVKNIKELPPPPAEISVVV
ncbi:MAG TPA: VWA domain-containing protein [Candidatus Elarobacter sp.]